MRTRMISAALALGCGVTLALLFALRGPASLTAAGEAAQAGAKEDDGLRKAMQAYAAAYNKGDIETLMTFWAPDAEFLDESGKVTRGREAIHALLKKSLQDHKDVSLKITTKSLRMIRPDVAVHDGIAKVTSSDGYSDTGPFMSIWTKTDGKWLLSRVHDLPSDSQAASGSNYETLKQLEWLVGDWESEGKNTLVTFSCKWTKNQNYLTIDQTIHLKDQEALTLTQIIGFDPLQQQVRSWVFDLRGGFGEGLWIRAGNRWDVASAGVLSDGRQATADNTWKYIDDNMLDWESVDRTIDDKPVPDVKVRYVKKTVKK